MNADGLKKLVGCVSREEGHEHVLENRLFKINNNQVDWYTKHMHTGKQCTYLVAFGFNHEGVWHKQSGVGFLNEGHGHRRYGDLGWKGKVHVKLGCKQQRAEGLYDYSEFLVREPWCLCRRLWSGSRSSCRRQTSYPGTRCLSAERTCSLLATTFTVSGNSAASGVRGKRGVKEDWLCRSSSSLLTSLNSLWYWALVFDS